MAEKAFSILDVKQRSKKIGITCLSNEYVNRQTKMRWRCLCGKVFAATAHSVMSSESPCKRCYGRHEEPIKEFQRIAKSKGGICLSKVYVNAVTKLSFQCGKCGYQWKTLPSVIKRGGWCRKCADIDNAHRQRFNLTKVAKIAVQFGGELLSTQYIRNNEKLEWRCAEGHIFQKTYDKVRSGSWCTECSRGLGERICRTAFEQLFKTTFPKERPLWLVNVRGNRMELDGYSALLKVAFEHQGRHHFSSSAYYASPYRKKDDKTKRKLCQQYGIALIEVPEIPGLLRPDDVKKFIEKACKRQKVSLPRDFQKTKIDFSSSYAPADKSFIERLKVIASSKRGRWISNSYNGARVKTEWECKDGHRWHATPEKIVFGQWCPTCAALERKGKYKVTILEMRRRAKDRGGKCLSTKYQGMNVRLQWSCSKKHIWEATPASTKNNWCPICGKEKVQQALRKTIDEMQKVAKKRDGKCLSKEYKNMNSKLLWACSKGHSWEASPGSIIHRKSWCPYCSGKMGTTIETLKALAQEKNGLCLSKAYTGALKKHIWQCKNGHQWEALPSNVKRGTWCPMCAGRTRVY